ncbi:hypothetical protein C8R47DRAFT_639295 [Mycena vitilis]|nr:hypothetical protein C8R47DRAFT_639295 [Mycena vitilis]
MRPGSPIGHVCSDVPSAILHRWLAVDAAQHDPAIWVAKIISLLPLNKISQYRVTRFPHFVVMARCYGGSCHFLKYIRVIFFDARFVRSHKHGCPMFSFERSALEETDTSDGCGRTSFSRSIKGRRLPSWEPSSWIQNNTDKAPRLVPTSVSPLPHPPIHLIRARTLLSLSQSDAPKLLNSLIWHRRLGTDAAMGLRRAVNRFNSSPARRVHVFRAVLVSITSTVIVASVLIAILPDTGLQAMLAFCVPMIIHHVLILRPWSDAVPLETVPSWHFIILAMEFIGTCT